MITETLIMLRVGKSAVPSFTLENIDVSMRQADVKSGDRKNTHVTLIIKKVSRAKRKLED